MAGKTKPGSALKGINIKLKMINDLMDVTGSAKDSWNPAEISDDMKAIAYIHRLADTWNPAQLNEALKYLGFDTIDSWNPAIIEETKNKLVKYFLPTEATGNPITFNTYGNLPCEVSKAEVTFLPKQDLHGQSAPYPAGGGKNLLPVFSTVPIGSGIVSVLNTDGSVKINGTSTDSVYSNSVTVSLKAGNYVVSKGTPLVKSETGIQIATLNLICDGESLNFSLSEDTDLSVRIRIGSGVTLNETWYPMIRKSSDSADYAPYSNICPISGWTELNLTVADAETSPTQTETYTESLGSTYYGGKVDFVSGEGLEEWDYIASYDGETLPGEWISDRDVYAPETTPTTGAEVAYKLSESVELTLTPTEIELLKGQNVLWTDGDNIVIEYKALLNS